MSVQKLILASASPARLKLLEKIGVIPYAIIPADIDESEYRGELPRNIASRLAISKAEKIAVDIEDGYILAADSVAALGRRTLPKALNADMVRDCLRLQSGRRHSLYTGLCLIKKESGKIVAQSSKIVVSKIKFKLLTEAEIEYYVGLEEGLNKAGGYTIGGYAESFVEFLSGSHSNVMGLPLYETRMMLVGLGFLLL
jgi:septum formation protein